MWLHSANPYKPRGWTGEIELTESEDIPLLAGVPVQVATPDPDRLWLLVGFDSAAATLSLWPSRALSIKGITDASGIGAILLHNASYPSLVQGTWWATADGGPTIVRVITARSAPTQRE